MKRNIKCIYIVIITLIFGNFINVNASSNIVYVEGTYQQKNARNMLSLINNWRKDTTNNWYYDQKNEKVYPGELKPLTYDYGLEAIAMQRAAEIALSFSHTRPNGERGVSMIDPHKWRGENLSYVVCSYYDGSDAVQEQAAGIMFTNLCNSPSHLENMTFGSYTKVGIATAVSVVNGQTKLTTAYMFSN